MSCVTQVYDTSNANFQASVTISSGGEILGGYDTSLNQLIFACENTDDPAKVNDVTSGWISASPSYASNKNKIGLDDNCAGSSTSTPVLLYDIPSSVYTDTIISQITKIVVDGKTIIVCGGNFNRSNMSPGFGARGFIFSFDLETGAPYNVLSKDIENPAATKDGWIVTYEAGFGRQTVINSIYGASNGNVIVGGTDIKLIVGPGNYNEFRQRYEYLKIIKITGAGEGDFTFTNLPNNTAIPDFDYDWGSGPAYNPPTYTDITLIEVIDIKPGMTGAGNVIVVYQINTYKNANDITDEFAPPGPVDPSNVHIRELDFTGNTWKNNDFKLPEPSSSRGDGWSFSRIKYTSSVYYVSTYDITQLYIAATGTSSTDQFPMIYSIDTTTQNEFELSANFANARALYGGMDEVGVQVYIPDPPAPGQGNSLPPGQQLFDLSWKGLQIDNISYIAKSFMNLYVSGVQTNTLFVTLSSIDSPQTNYISFISAGSTFSLFPPSTSTPSSIPNSTILNAIINESSSTMTINDQKLIEVKLDNYLSGNLNDLQFKLAFSSSKLHLFAFGNYVNSPSNGSISSFALLNAISNICLSKGTQILCDQGIINIEKINTRKHTINNKQINHITQSIHTDDYLIKIKKNCLSSNSPSSDIICSGDHKILYKNNLIEAKNLCDLVCDTEKIKNDKRILYNILMDKHEIIIANNTPVESLHPQNIFAVFYNNYNNPQARKLLSDKIGQLNKHNNCVNKINNNKLNGLLGGNNISKNMHLKNMTFKK